MRTVVLYARSPEWRDLIARADELMASPNFRVLKSEARTRAGFIDVPGAGPAFIKRVEIRPGVVASSHDFEDLALSDRSRAPRC